MGKDRRLQRAANQQAKKTEAAGVSVTLREASLLGAGQRQTPERPYISLKYYYPDYQCFSEWEPEKLKGFSSLCRKLAQMRWAEIYRTGGSVGHKTGVAYTVHNDLKKLPKHPDLADLSPDLTWFELRVDEESRVHGFRVADAFFLVFLDRAHQIYPG